MTASGDSLSGLFGIRCTLPKCNTPDALNNAKAIFAKYNLTDADGRLVEFVKRSHGHGLVASMIVVVGLTLFSSIAV